MTESDWKVFRKLVPGLRERYLKSRNREIAALLAEPNKDETRRFWNTFERMETEARILRDCLDGHRRSTFFLSLCLMLKHGMLLDEDLTQFSPELAEHLREERRSAARMRG